MHFLKERIEVICAQLKKQAFGQKVMLHDWQVKKGNFLTPENARENASQWQDFDGLTDHWYGPDEHYWFKTCFTVPEALNGKTVWLKVFTQIEEWDDGKNPQFLLFLNGDPVQGLDMNHREVLLTCRAETGQRYDVQLQAYTGTLHSEFRLLVQAVEVVIPVYELYYDIQMPLWAMARMNKEDQAYRDIETILNDTINLIDFRKVYGEEYFNSIAKASTYIQKHLYKDLAGFEEVAATCIGHTHIDVAWWWTVEQTKEKVARSFATVLKLMDEYPEYKFMSSQPQLYAFLKARYPELYGKVKQRVDEGRWEVEGGMWLEADCNLTSGESLVRQFLYGKRFFQEEFGKENRVLWLPDVFGYSGALPQICLRCGIDYFMTTKLSWNQFNKIPCDTFWWKGIDGSRVFTHFISTLGVGQSTDRFFTTYNGMLHPDAIMGAWARYQQKDINNDILIAFGYGDGGGGPTREMLETGRRMEKGVRGIPKVRQAFAGQYFEEIYDRVKDHKRLPTWSGEFYFEYHRGTYTSMARNKRSNRKSELLLMDAELLSVLGQDMGIPYPKDELKALWENVLLNQFHDILPGSSIREVYEVTKAEYKAIAEKGGSLVMERLNAMAGPGGGYMVFNPLGFVRSDIVFLEGLDADFLIDADSNRYPVQKSGDGALAYLENLPSKGYCIYQPASGEKAKSAFVIAERKIDTPFYHVEFDFGGIITRFDDVQNGRSVLREGALGNLFRMYEDKPIYYDNWDIDVFYTEKHWDVVGVTEMNWVENGPVAAALQIKRAFSNSVMIQTIRFYAKSRRVDFETYVDWKENQHLLKVLFPLDLNTDEATFDIQFGNVTRKTHKNTSWEQARFESCAHKWMDVSEGDYGVSLLNDCKYGHSVDDGVMGLTLIKSGIEPNPTTDQEEHYFTYSLYPHKGTWRDANTPYEAYKLNQPGYGLPGKEGTSFSFAAIDREHVILETVKQAEDERGIILRVYENQNKRTRATITLCKDIGTVWECDLLERDERPIPAQGKDFSFDIRPYEIKTFRVTWLDA